MARALALLALAISAAWAAAAEPCRDLQDPRCRAQLDPRCRQAAQALLATIREPPPGGREADRRRHAAVLAAAESAVAEGRAQGLGDCEVLARLQKIVVNQ